MHKSVIRISFNKNNETFHDLAENAVTEFYGKVEKIVDDKVYFDYCFDDLQHSRAFINWLLETYEDDLLTDFQIIED